MRRKSYKGDQKVRRAMRKGAKVRMGDKIYFVAKDLGKFANNLMLVSRDRPGVFFHVDPSSVELAQTK